MMCYCYFHMTTLLFNPIQTDLGHREVSESEGKIWAETKGFLYFETSALTGGNVVEMFHVSSF